MLGRGKAWLVMLLASPLIAGATEPVVHMEWYASSDPSTPIQFNPADMGDSTPGADGSTIYVGSMLNEQWQGAWTTRGRSDESSSYLDAGLSIINLSSQAQSFFFDTRLNMAGSSGSDSVVQLDASLALTNMDFSGNANMDSFDGQSIVQALLGNSQVASVFDAPYELETVGPFSSIVDDDSSETMPGVFPADTISALTSFTLSPGDLLNITYLVDVTTIPAPGAIALLGLAALSGRRRRRRTRRPTALEVRS